MNLIASNFLYARDDLRHSPLRGEETLLPLPFRERVGVRVKLGDVNRAERVLVRWL